MASKAMAHLDLALCMSPHDPQNVRIYMALAAAHYAAGRFTEAVGHGRQAVQQRQGFSGGHRIYVASLAQDGQIDEAIGSFRAAVKSYPSYAPAFYNLGNALAAKTAAKFVSSR